MYVGIGFGHHISSEILVVVESVRNDERKKVIAHDKKKSCKFKFNCKNTLTKKKYYIIIFEMMKIMFNIYKIITNIGHWICFHGKK